jgi:arsenite methyltransferase
MYRPGSPLGKQRAEASNGNVIEFDAEAARRVEAMYMTPDVVEQREEVRRRLRLSARMAVLDVGSGPGLLAAELAAEVGAAGRVCGVDVSADMVAMASARAVPASSAPMEFREAPAESLPYPDAIFDAVACTQVLEYVPDVATALREMYRVLRPGGRVLVLDTDWDSVVWHSGDPVRMNRVMDAWEDHLADPRLPRTLRGALDAAGFTTEPPAVLPILNSGYSENTLSAGAIGLIADYVPGHHRMTQADAEAWAVDLRSMGDAYFFSLNRYLFTAQK